MRRIICLDVARIDPPDPDRGFAQAEDPSGVGTVEDTKSGEASQIRLKVAADPIQVRLEGDDELIVLKGIEGPQDGFNAFGHNHILRDGAIGTNARFSHEYSDLEELPNVFHNGLSAQGALRDLLPI